MDGIYGKARQQVDLWMRERGEGTPTHTLTHSLLGNAGVLLALQPPATTHTHTHTQMQTQRGSECSGAIHSSSHPSIQSLQSMQVLCCAVLCEVWHTYVPWLCAACSQIGGAWPSRPCRKSAQTSAPPSHASTSPSAHKRGGHGRQPHTHTCARPVCWCMAHPPPIHGSLPSLTDPAVLSVSGLSRPQQPHLAGHVHRRSLMDKWMDGWMACVRLNWTDRDDVGFVLRECVVRQRQLLHTHRERERDPMDGRYVRCTHHCDPSIHPSVCMSVCLSVCVSVFKHRTWRNCTNAWSFVSGGMPPALANRSLNAQ